MSIKLQVKIAILQLSRILLSGILIQTPRMSHFAKTRQYMALNSMMILILDFLMKKQKECRLSVIWVHLLEHKRLIGISLVASMLVLRKILGLLELLLFLSVKIWWVKSLKRHHIWWIGNFLITLQMATSIPQQHILSMF